MVENTSVQIEQLAPRTFMRLKSWLPSSPDGALPIASVEEVRVISVRPGEWWLISQRTGADLHERLAAQTFQHGFTLVDLSDGYATFGVRGARARELLSKGCGLDLYSRYFPEGHCARTRFAQIPVLIECIGGSQAFELTAARSYVQYLQGWLADAALEYGGHAA